MNMWLIPKTGAYIGIVLYQKNLKKEKYTCTHMHLDLCLDLSVSNSCNNRVSECI